MGGDGGMSKSDSSNSSDIPGSESSERQHYRPRKKVSMNLIPGFECFMDGVPFSQFTYCAEEFNTLRIERC